VEEAVGLLRVALLVAIVVVGVLVLLLEIAALVAVVGLLLRVAAVVILHPEVVGVANLPAATAAITRMALQEDRAIQAGVTSLEQTPVIRQMAASRAMDRKEEKTNDYQ
jgi:hypothetical protein